MTTEQIARPKSAALPRERARKRSRVEEVAIEEPPLAEDVQSLSGEHVGVRVTRIEWVLYGFFTIIGAIMRMWDLSSRALHHDESLHATYTWYLWQKITGVDPTQGYYYDPMMHGPYQFHGNLLTMLIFGDNNVGARMNAAICGTMLIVLPILLRRQMGRVAALVLSGLVAFSPAYLYYSRFTREDIYFALWTAICFIGVLRWLDARGQRNSHRWLYVAAAGLALAWATLESTYFIIGILVSFVFGIFVIGYLYQWLAPRRRPAPRGQAQGARRAQAPPENLFVATLGRFARANLPPLVEAFRGTPLSAWGISIGIMALITVIMFWPIGHPASWGLIPGAHSQPTTNAAGQTVSYNTDFLTGGLSYWKLQQDVMRGAQPWYYYFLVIPLYEQVAVVFGAAGLVYYLLGKRSMSTMFCGAAFLLFGGLALFMGAGVSHSVELLFVLLAVASFVALMVSQPRSPLINLILWWTILTWALYTYAGEKMPWLTLHLLLPLFFVAALFIGHLLTSLRRLSLKWTITVALLALLSIISFRSSVALAYADGANPTEMLIYTQTSPDVPAVSNVLHSIPAQKATSGQLVRDWIDNADLWPWIWYVHDEPASYHSFGAGSDTNTTAAGQSAVAAAQQRYPVLIIGWEDMQNYLTKNNQLQALSNYTGYEFKLRWWFPEDGYKAWETTGLGGFLSDTLRPQTWANMWNWWLNRTPFDQQAFTNWNNVYKFFVYFRNDDLKYVPSSWAAAHQRALADSVYVSQPTLNNDEPSALTHPVVPLLTVNAGTLAQPMAVVRAVAVDKAGNIYLTDSSSQHVIKLDRTGRFLTSWGGIGSAPGKFSGGTLDPMGIAVGPNGHVYVSDTWNGRVQEFSANGAFVRAFGQPNPQGTNGVPGAASGNSFYGPRQLAVAPNGNIYVADTGNKRIQVYSPQGQHLFNIGDGSASSPTATGHFNEPSGVAVDAHGIVYVADYWNKRIQRFTLNGTEIGTPFPINGWAFGDYSEPYLAVDNAGHLFATDAPTASNAHANHVLELNAMTGAVIKAFGATGNGPGVLSQPSGVAVGPDGALYIADANAAKLYKLQP